MSDNSVSLHKLYLVTVVKTGYHHAKYQYIVYANSGDEAIVKVKEWLDEKVEDFPVYTHDAVEITPWLPLLVYYSS